MKQVEIYSVQELLLTPTFKHNQKGLADFLNVSRNSIGKYKDDVECVSHCVIKRDGKYTFMATTR